MPKNLLLICHSNHFSNHFIHHRNSQLEGKSVLLQGNSSCSNNSHHNNSHKNNYSIKIDLRNSSRTSEQSLQRHSQLRHKMKLLQGIQNKIIISNNKNNNKLIPVDVLKVQQTKRSKYNNISDISLLDILRYLLQEQQIFSRKQCELVDFCFSYSFKESKLFV